MKFSVLSGQICQPSGAQPRSEKSGGKRRRQRFVKYEVSWDLMKVVDDVVVVVVVVVYIY